MHYSFFGSGSPENAKANSGEIETRQWPWLLVLPATKVIFFVLSENTVFFEFLADC